MHQFSIFLVFAVIAATVKALSVAENTWGTTSDLLTSSGSNPAIAEQDVTGAGVNLPLDIMAADVPCSPSENQVGKKNPSKIRRQQACYLDDSWDKTTPPNAKEQRQQPYQISNPDDTENNPSGADATEYSDFLDHFRLCNPLLVGANRKFPVCDSGRVRDRSIFLGRIDYVSNIMANGFYVLMDVRPGTLLPQNPSPKITHVPGRL